jgi:PRC-barrel domain
MDHTTHTPLNLAEQTEANLVGATIYDRNDDKVGTISHLHGVAPSGSVIVDVGGFLGIGTHPVALPMSEISLMRDSAGAVRGVTSRSREAIEAMPAHDH